MKQVITQQVKMWGLLVGTLMSILIVLSILSTESIQAYKSPVTDPKLSGDSEWYVYIPVINKPLCPISGSGGTETVEIAERNASKIRLDLKTRAYQYGFSLWEVEIYGPGTGNLTSGATATASSWENTAYCIDCTPDKAIDHDMDTRWASEFYEPQWLEITLPSPQVINRIVLNWETAYATEYCITTSE